MSDQEMEEMLMAIESEILTLNLKNALELAVSMKLEESRVKDKSIFTVIKVIRQDIEEKVGNLSDKEAIKEYLSAIKVLLQRIFRPLFYWLNLKYSLSEYVFRKQN